VAEPFGRAGCIYRRPADWHELIVSFLGSEPVSGSAVGEPGAGKSRRTGP
jgi:hypothetical protein